MAGRRKAEPTIASELLDAVRFVGLIQKDNGTEADQFCMIYNGWISSFNGSVGIGAPIVQQFVAAPHNKRFEAALIGCTQDLQIAQLSSDRLHVRSGDFQAFVPCCPAENLRNLTQPTPDAARMAVDDTLKAAIVRAGALASPKAKNVLCQAVTLNADTAIATNNTCIIEMWHGYAVRDAMHIPKTAVVLLGKIKKKLTALGWSENTVTFHFADRSWLKSKLFTEQIPDLRKYLLKQENVPNAVAPPQGFFTVVGKLLKFAYDGRVYCANDAITAWENAGRDKAAEGSYEVPGAPANLSFNARDLLEIENLVETIDFRAIYEAAMFFGKGCRGAVRWEDMIPKVQVPLPSLSWKPEPQSTKCYNCGSEFPNNKYICPHCGVGIGISDEDIPF